MSYHLALPFDTRALKSQHKAGINIKDEKSLIRKIKKLRQRFGAIQTQLAHTKEVQNDESTAYFDLRTNYNYENIVEVTDKKIHQAEEELFHVRLIQKNKSYEKRKGQRKASALDYRLNVLMY